MKARAVKFDEETLSNHPGPLREDIGNNAKTSADSRATASRRTRDHDRTVRWLYAYSGSSGLHSHGEPTAFQCVDAV